ncbi:hypothetical protein rsdtw13_17180 [Clostridium sp. TW13]|uniref:Uncharacterized protein n=1 Tax=Inconstantimicrobium mannanitabidum TaxID=1604901 RepID=A0ACB5RBF7_9CLOT|nr:hypothetical protein rsdtw13_17180 [Clostridium sp. TW13]
MKILFSLSIISIQDISINCKYMKLLAIRKNYCSHRAMAAILSSILKLSPVHKAMASKQIKSVYLAKLLENS